MWIEFIYSHLCFVARDVSKENVALKHSVKDHKLFILICVITFVALKSLSLFDFEKSR